MWQLQEAKLCERGVVKLYDNHCVASDNPSCKLQQLPHTGYSIMCRTKPLKAVEKRTCN